MTLVVLSSLSLAAALACALRWWRPAAPALAAGASRYQGGRDGAADADRLRRMEVGAGATVLSFGLAPRLLRRPQDLAIAKVSAEEFAGAKVALAVIGAGTVLGPATVLGLAGDAPPVRALTVACLAAAALGYELPDLRVTRVARRRRDELAGVIAFVARLTRIAVAGGRGIESAVPLAAEFGDGWGHDVLRLTLKERPGRSVQHSLLALGHRFGVPEAEQLGDALAVAQENGSPLLGALAASAHGIHGDRLKAAESAEARRSVLLSLPMGLMVLGFLIVLVSGFIAETLHLFTR